MHVKMTRKERWEIRRLAIAYQKAKSKLMGNKQFIETILGMIFIAVGLIIYPVLATAKPPEVWIASPNGKSRIKLPLYQAMRIVRKHGWHYPEMTPKLTRWEHLKTALLGERYARASKA